MNPVDGIGDRRPRRSCGTGRRRWRLAAAAGLLAISWHAAAQIATDGTLGLRTSLAGPDYRIPPSLGITRGSNLFLSFTDFNLAAGERATFTGGSAIGNVVARVTGGVRSSIDGTLRSELPGANVYFLNPAGVVFGPNAVLAIDGSFHVSTADYLRFPDGGRFDARTPEASILSSAAPAAWGFITDRPAGIAFDGARGRDSAVPADAGFQAGVGGHLSVTAGDIRLSSGVARDGTAGGAWVLSRGGRIDLTAVGSRGEIALPGQSAPDTALATGPIVLTEDAYIQQVDGAGILIRGGEIIMADRATLDTASSRNVAPGPLVVSADTLTMRDASMISSLAFDSAPGPALELQLRGALTLVGNRDAIAGRGTLLASATSGTGDAGTIAVDAGQIRIGGDASIVGFTEGPGTGARLLLAGRDAIVLEGFGSIIGQLKAGATGAGGEVRIAAPSIVLQDNAFIGTVNLGAGRGSDLRVSASDTVRMTGRSYLFGGAMSDGPAGRITIEAPRIVLAGGAIEASTVGPAAAGDIVIRAAESFSMIGGSAITSTTDGAGSAGHVAISAPQVTIEGARVSTGSSARLVPADQAGAAGDLLITGDTVRIANGALLDSTTQGGGSGGRVTIRAADVEIAGTRSGLDTTTSGAGSGGSIAVEAEERIVVTDGAVVLAGTSGPGAAGQVVLSAGGSLQVTDGATIINFTIGDGAAGGTTLRAPRIELRNVVLTSSSTRPEGASLAQGRAGEIRLTGEDLTMSNARVYTSSESLGPAGAIIVRAGDLNVSGGRIDASTLGPSAAGIIDIVAEKGMTLADGASITSLTTGSGPGGAVAISAGRLAVTGGSIIEANSFGTGEAGSLHIAARDGVHVTDGAIATIALSATGGNITIVTPTIVHLQQGHISASVGGAGNGGNIRIDPHLVVLQGASSITATAVTGDGGNIQIRISGSGALLQDSAARISASSDFGIDGTVRVDGPVRDLSGGLRVLNVSYLDPAALVRTACAARRSAYSSSLVLHSRRDMVTPAGEPLVATIFDIVDEKRPQRASSRQLTSLRTGGAAYAHVECVH